MRVALGKGDGRDPPTYPRLQETLSDLEDRAAEIRRRLAEMGPELPDRLAEVARLRGWQVSEATSSEEAVSYVCELAVCQRAGLVTRSDQEVFEGLRLDDALSGDGVEVVVMAHSQEQPREDLREAVARAGIGITGVDYAIAETGSVVLLPRPGLSRLVSLAPPVHVALVRPRDVLESLEDYFALQRLAYHRGQGAMERYVNFITGPSRTADIEQTLVIGVHGPREAHLVILRYD